MHLSLSAVQNTGGGTHSLPHLVDVFVWGEIINLIEASIEFRLFGKIMFVAMKRNVLLLA